jgi:hypothetical protein
MRPDSLAMAALSRRIILFLSIFICFTPQLKALPDLVASFSDVEALLERVPQGTGKLLLTVESFSGKNAKRVSQVADRVEIWLGARRIASLDANSPQVVEEGRRRRIFPFPPIELSSGYYFLTVRLYRKGSFSARQKWQGETFQVGIHPGRTTRLHKTIPIFLW